MKYLCCSGDSGTRATRAEPELQNDHEVSLVMALYSLIMVNCNLGWKHYNTMHFNTNSKLL